MLSLINKLQKHNYYFIVFNICLSLFLLLEIYLYKSVNFYIIFVTIITLIYIINRSKNINLIFINSLILFITLRLIFFVSSHFKIFPFIDTYWELAVVKTFVDNEKVFAISDYKGGVSPLEGYSNWPILHIYEYIGVLVSGIDPITLHMFNLLIIGLLPFVFTYIVIRFIYIKMNLPTEFVYIALIAYATLPDTTYWSIKLIRNTFGWVFMIMIIFIMLQYHKKPSHIILLFILSAAIVLSHHWSALMLLMLLLSVYLLTIYKPHNRLTRKTLSFTFIIIIAIIMIIWWLYYANILFEMVSFDKAFTLNIDRWTPRFPPELTPFIWIQILRIKTIIMYIPFILGSYFIYRLAKSHNKEFVSRIFIFHIVSVLLLFFNLLIDLEPTRVIILLIPFFITSLAIFYLQIYIRYKHSIYILIPFMISTSFIGIFSYSIMPLHLYTNIINPLDIGEHPNSLYFNSYIKEIDFTTVSSIFSDDTEILAMLLDSSQLHKIEKLSQESITEEFFRPNSNRIVIITKDFLVYRYAAGGLSYISYEDALQLRNILKQKMINTNLIYNDSHSSIYQ